MAVPRRLEGRIALVVGASRGLGAAVARRLGAEGAHLILSARTVGGLETTDDAIRKAGGLPATIAPLDLSDGVQADRLGRAVFDRFGRLDALFAAAGALGILSPVGHIDPGLWDKTVTLNLTGAYRLIRSLDPLLRASEAGRAAFATDRASRVPAAYWGLYAATKAGLDALVLSYAAEVAHTKLRVNLAEPPPFRSQLRAQAFPGEDQNALPEPDAVAPAVVDLLLPDCTRHGERVTIEPKR